MVRIMLHLRPMIAILAATMLVVALACGGEEATPTSPPTATSRPTATSPVATVTVAPTATSAVPTATLEPGVATAAATVAATATPVPEATLPLDYTKDWVNYLLNHPGYKPEWGTPKYGGIYKTADPTTGTRWDITLGWSAFSRWQFAQFNSLLAFDTWLPIGSEPYCDLCESWEMNADGTKLTFKLRQGVKFHSEGWGKDLGAPGFGTEMVCEDIKSSMEWFANPHEATYAGTKIVGKLYMGHLKEVTCPDGPQGYTAVLNFTHFRNLTVGWLASGIRIRDKEYTEWLDTNYPGIQSTAKPEGYLANMGTGPMIAISANPEVVMKSKTNPNYFIKGAPFIAGQENYSILDYNTKFAALLTGKIDQAGHGSSGITKAQVVQVQKSYTDSIELHIVRYNHIQYLRMNPLLPPTDNWKVRWAVMLAMDRGEWMEFNKAGAIEMASPVYYLHSDSSWSIPKEEFQTYPGYRLDKKDEDLAEANRLLDEVFGPGIRPKLEVYVRPLLSRREITLWSIDQFRKNLKWEWNLNYIDDTAYGKINTSCSYTIHADAKPPHGMTYSPDPSDAYGQTHSKWASWDRCEIEGWKGTDEGKSLQPELDRVDALIAELDTSRDVARRQELSRYLEKYMMEERTTAATLGVMNVAWANRSYVKGVYYYNLGTYSQQRMHDRLWFSE